MPGSGWKANDYSLQSLVATNGPCYYVVTRARPVSPALALGVAALGIGLFSVMDAFMKSLTLAIGVYNAMLWRTLVSTGLGGLAWSLGRRGRPSARAVRLHLARGVVFTAMTTMFFWGLARVPMAQAVTLTYIAPLIALLLAAVTLGERVGRRVVAASLVGFGGVGIVMIGQRHAALGPAAFAGSLAILGSALLYAINLVIARLQSQAARPSEIAFFQSVVIVVVLALAAPWLAAWPAVAQWPKLAIAALLGTTSLWLLAWAYAHAPTGYLATTEYTSFLYAAALGFLVFGERLSPWTLAGAAVIVVACLYAARAGDVAGGGLEASA